MGKGRDLAGSTGNPKMDELLDDLKDQLIIVLMKRLMDDKNQVRFHVSEIDDTGGQILAMEILEDKTFLFTVKDKS